MGRTREEAHRAAAARPSPGPMVLARGLGGALADERDRHGMGADALARDAAGGMGGAQEGGLRRLGAVLRDNMTFRRARCFSNSAASASRIRMSDLSRICWLSFTRRCAASLTACAWSRISEGSIAQPYKWVRTFSVRPFRH